MIAATRTPAPSLGRIERAMAWSVVLLVGLLGVIGAVNSFAEVREATEPAFGHLAWTVPLGIDVGIVGVTALDLLLCRLQMRLSWLRLVPWGLVVVTVALNVAPAAGEGDVIGAVAHGVLPGLWIVAVESAAHVLRWWAGITDHNPSGERRMDRVRVSRWFLAPLATARLRRRMVLREQTSYQTAIDRDLELKLARAEMQDEHGPLWRLRAPRRQRVLYRHGELTPSRALTTAAEESTPASVTTGRSNGREASNGHSPPRQTTKRRRASSRRPAPEPAELAVGRAVRDELSAAGRALTRDALTEGVRARGIALSNERGSQLLAALKDEAKTQPEVVS